MKEYAGVKLFQLVDMTLMIGTDYFPGIKGIGPKKALHLIKKKDINIRLVYFKIERKGS